ncbi:MAG: histidinol-phosphatase HisJ family protein [Ruminococcaceae bacterium]|nr:histidinol-phosphatase HisJ family protein [Oscillospiraceae bacterium]
MLHSYHNHTYRCNHADGTEREYIEEAIAAGIKTLGFADHVPMPFGGEYYSFFRMKLNETDEYFKTLESLKKEYSSDIKIRIGFEAEYYPDVFPKMINFLKDYPYEYLILGQHALGNEENDHYCSRKTTDKNQLTRYIDQVTEGISTGKFLYIAHPDILNFVGDDDFYRAEMSRFCKFAKEKNIPLEINVLGMREGRNYPNAEFWRLAAEHGCEAVLGADAHHSYHVHDTENIKKARDLADSVGIKMIETLEDRLDK